MKIRIATWNVASGRKMNSLDRFDYEEKENLNYFKSQLAKLNLDIICIQESQFNDSDSFAKRLGDSLGFPYVAETPGCPSHVDRNYKMTPAIISKQPFIFCEYFRIPYPNFKLIHNGKEYPPFDRYFLMARYGNFNIVTAHPEPLGMFDMTYEGGDGKKLGKEIDSLVNANFDAPITFAVDLNFDNTALVLPESTAKFSLKEALTVKDTTPKGGHPDHILYSDEFKVIDSGVLKTETDHFLCWAELER
jgi:hypothetical protein